LEAADAPRLARWAAKREALIAKLQAVSLEV
jgi:hypothetical protein